MTFTAPTFTAPSPADLKEFVTTNFEHGASARIDDQDPDEGSVTIEVDFPNGGNLVMLVGRRTMVARQLFSEP
jgi:hypothetical protein